MYSSKKQKQSQTILQKLDAIQKIGLELEVPYTLKCMFTNLRSVSIVGNQVTFNEDYMNVEQVREGIDWLVNQFGGTVKWKD